MLLVTSRIDGAWCLVERSLSSSEDPLRIASDAAFEACGVRGSCRRLGQVASRRSEEPAEVVVLRVSREARRFPDHGKRRHEWLSPLSASERLSGQPELMALVANLGPADLPEAPPDARPAPWRRPPSQPRVVCLDLDDTVLSRGDEPLPGAVAACEVLVERGYRLVASTARLDPVWEGSPRASKIRARLDEIGFPIAELSVDVPPADLYVDDKGWPFDGDWEALLDEVRGQLARSRRLRLSLALAGCLMNPQGGPLHGAREAHAELRALGVERVVSLGNFRPELATPAQRVRAAEAWLAEAGIEPSRVHPGKISSHLYVDTHAYRFEGRWQDALPAILGRLA
ncbi:MAG TPA: hypothetical protein DEA08_27800 [Planctomycetes bacterium]|nr:hypothetical protein [Planctomycetota bacterium]